jgi:hypothetical protein
MARWNAPPKVEQIEQLALIACLSTHHGKPPECLFADIHEHFFNSIDPKRTFMGLVLLSSARPAEA